MRYRIDIKPPQELAQELEDYLESIGPDVIRPLMLSPHCTIMGLHAHHEDEAGIIAAVRDIAANMAPFMLTTGGFDLFSDNGGRKNIFVLKLSGPGFQNLHKEVIEALREFIDWGDYREGDRQDAIWRKYGSSFYGEKFNPHVSMAKVKAERVRVGEELAGREWPVASIGVARREDDGWKTIIEFSLAANR
jgi:hypothetical protein